MKSTKQRIGFLLDEVRFNGFARDVFGEEWSTICQTTSKVPAGQIVKKSGMAIRKNSPYREFLNEK